MAESNDIEETVAMHGQVGELAGLCTLERKEPRVSRGVSVQVCCFRVVNDGAVPYLMYALQRDALDTLTWPSFVYNDGMASHAAMDLFGDSPGVPALRLTYHGYRKEKGKLQVWLESKTPPGAQALRAGDAICWALPSELVNERRVVGTPVRAEITQFLLRNPCFARLCDSAGAVLESPLIAYQSGTYDEMRRATTLGATRRWNGIYQDGHFWYAFSSYGDSMRSARNTANEDAAVRCQQGLGRFAVFLGKHERVSGLDSWRGTCDSVGAGEQLWVRSHAHYSGIGYYALENRV